MAAIAIGIATMSEELGWGAKSLVRGQSGSQEAGDADAAADVAAFALLPCICLANAFLSFAHTVWKTKIPRSESFFVQFQSQTFGEAFSVAWTYRKGPKSIENALKIVQN